MFICDRCKNPAPPNTRCNRIVVDVKDMEHPFRSRANRIKKEDGKWEAVPDQGGIGKQIVREIKVCQKCIDSVL